MRVSTRKLTELAVFTTWVTGLGVGTMYYLMQKKFSSFEFHQEAVRKLEACSVAMESLGAPPLKVHHIRIFDRQNYIDSQYAQIKIPVKGSKTGGYLYTSSERDEAENRWSLKQAVLKLREGQLIDLLDPSQTTTTAENQETSDTNE